MYCLSLIMLGMIGGLILSQSSTVVAHCVQAAPQSIYPEGMEAEPFCQHWRLNHDPPILDAAAIPIELARQA
jgi:hypothetical protein